MRLLSIGVSPFDRLMLRLGLAKFKCRSCQGNPYTPGGYCFIRKWGSAAMQRQACPLVLCWRWERAGR